jgi:CRISPR-associated protein Cas1
MPTLYITDQQATLGKTHNRLVVERDHTKLAEIHDFRIDRVVIFGNVQVSTQAMAFLLDRGIDTTFLSSRGRLKGRLAPLASKNAFLRVRQYERIRDPRFVARVAAAIVSGKIFNCSEVLARHQRNHPECNLHLELSLLARLSAKAGEEPPLDALRGIEGQAAAIYFKGFPRMLRRSMDFKKRTRRPPTDPINALLSFAYTLLYNEAIGALVSVGFDPYLGFLHSLDYGRCSLALDLIEELRAPVADRLVLNVTNLEVVKAQDFAADGSQGIYIKDAARKRFLNEYERLMTGEFPHRRTGERISFRRVLHDQALAMQRTVLHGEPYQPFRGWH